MTFKEVVELFSLYVDETRVTFQTEQKDQLSGKLVASGAFGFMEIELQFLESCVTWSTTYQITQNSTIKHYFPRPHINFQYLFQQGLTLEIEGLPAQSQKSEQYLILYMPGKPSVIQLNAGTYQLFGISVPHDLFQERWAHHAPDGWIQNNSHHPAIIYHRSLWINPKMQELIKDLKECPYELPLKKTYLDIKSSELIFNSLHNLQNPWFQQKLTQKDQQQMESIRGYLMEHLDDLGSLAAIARHFGINEFKLKKNFKLYYGHTIYGYVYEERMQRAWHLLVNSTKSIREIALSVSYTNLSAFSSAFKRRFGYPPTHLRQKD